MSDIYDAAAFVGEPEYRCNNCGGEVRWDAEAPSYRCDDPAHHHGLGRWVHVGEDCHTLLWAVTRELTRLGES